MVGRIAFRSKGNVTYSSASIAASVAGGAASKEGGVLRAV